MDGVWKKLENLMSGGGKEFVYKRQGRRYLPFYGIMVKSRALMKGGCCMDENE